MARRRYYRVKRVYPKQKWLPVSNEFLLASYVGLESNIYVTTIQPITENPTRNTASGEGNVSSATILKTGRVRIKGYLRTSVSDVSNIIGVAYIPEGYIINQSPENITQLGTTFFYRHPEWILCWTRMDYANAGQNNEFSLSSRLKRNLNSGDQIVVFRIAINTGSNAVSTGQIRGTITYVCRSN